ncbi:MAG: Na(+)/H(+) antiporter subunit B [Spirochaetia bacterium]|nr:Na(+)/H(+) antiporter subunit B [Spirochaetia bacterium]
MMKKLLLLAAIALLAFALWPFVRDVGLAEPGELATAYLERGPAELGTANVVTSIVVSYRGFDTLGEVTVLFTATAGVGGLLARRKSGHGKKKAAERGATDASEILKTASRLLSPLLVLFGVYIFLHGHLTPGGGFQGGVVIATAVLIGLLADPEAGLAHGVMHVVEGLSGFAYVALGAVGLWFTGVQAGFLDPRFLPLGELGRLASAGAIPIIYSLVGLKVGAELTGILDAMKEDAE